jgi:hypothetical protein
MVIPIKKEILLIKKRIIGFLFILIVSFNFIGCENNQKLVGKAFYYENRVLCDQVKLSTLCDNSCRTEAFLITNRDTVQLYGKAIVSRLTIKNGDTIYKAETLSTKYQAFDFFGKKCEILKNPLFEINKTYKIKGHFILQNKKPLQKAFYVTNCQIVK